MLLEMFLPKTIFILILFMWIFASFANALPSKDNVKIRIHVPLKHHTHVHTKTVLKKVPVPVPVKHYRQSKHRHGHKKHDIFKTHDDFEVYEHARKRRRTSLYPFL